MSSGRRILITGASRGLGLALAEHYLNAGDMVFGCSRQAPDLSHPAYSHFCMDVTEESAVAMIFASLRGSGGLDILINNAGVSSMNPVALTPLSTARRIVEVNFLGAFLFTRGAVRLLRNSEHGRIVNITTIAVPLGLEGEAVYAASKGALEVFTRVVAKEVGQFGITCNAVGPAPVDTRLTRQVPPDKIDALIAQQAIRLHAEPRDVINVVDFFLRPESRLVTAQVLYLGGFG